MTNHRRRRDLHDHVNLVTLCLTLIAATCAAIFTGLQSCTAQRQLAVAQDVEIRQLRAYVGLAGATLLPLQVNKPIEVILVLHNYGQTPAYTVSNGGFAGFFAATPDGTYPIQDYSNQVRPAATTVYPGIDVQFKPLSPIYETNASFESGHSVLVSYGTIYYVDAFGKARKSDYCVFLAQETHPPNYGMCRNHNGGEPEHP